MSDPVQFVHYSQQPYKELRPLSYEELAKDRARGRWKDNPEAVAAYIADRKKLEAELHRRLRQRGLASNPNASFLYGTLEGMEQFGQPGQFKHIAPLDDTAIRSAFFDVVGDGKSRTALGHKGLAAAIKRWRSAQEAGALKETEYMGMPIRPRVEVLLPNPVKPQIVNESAQNKQADLKPDVKLQPHQKRIQDLAEDHPVRLLLVHSLGSGKSLSGIAAAEAAKGPYTAVAPASLRPNYLKEIAKFTDQKTPADVMSYTEIGQGRVPDKVDTVIFDESQRLRNPDSKQTQQSVALADRAKQVLMLSGTPIVNHPSELTVPIRMLTGKQMSPEEFERKHIKLKYKYPTLFHRIFGMHRGAEMEVNKPEELKDLLRGHVDYYTPDKPIVPVTQEDIHVDMSPEQHRLYQGMWDKLPWWTRWKLQNEIALTPDELRRTMSFLTGPRQVGLSTYPYMRSPDPLKAFEQSPKLQKAMEKIKETLKDQRAKALVFSNYIGAGLEPYAAALQREKIPHAIFHGGLSDKERKQLVDDYNANKIRVALLGPSGMEGLSFRHSALIQLLDPHYQDVRPRQAVGRGVRYDSHHDLPPELQNVKVQRFFSRLPKGVKDSILSRLGFDRSHTQHATDDHLERISKQKSQLNAKFMDLLKEVGSEKKSAAKGNTPVMQLRQAKQESDRKNYKAKHALVRQLIMSEPGAFVVDSESNGILGLTHRSGFRIHLPRHAMPGNVTVRRLSKPPKPSLVRKMETPAVGAPPAVVPALV